MTPKYSLVIRWSDEDQCYIAWAPEFGTGAKTHGSTYEEAARMGRELIESLAEQEIPRRELPDPWLFTGIDPDEALGRQLFPSNEAYKEPAGRSPKQVKRASA